MKHFIGTILEIILQRSFGKDKDRDTNPQQIISKDNK